MRLLIVTNLFAPDQAGGAAIYTDFAVEMARRGHAVTVRCAYPYFPEWQDKSGKNGLRVGREELDGVHVERFGLVLPKQPQRLRSRLLFEGSHLASLGRSLFRGRFDVVLVFATHPSSTAFGALTSSLRRIPLWVNVQDLASDAARATGVAQEGRAAGVLQGVDRLMLGQADVLSGISPGMVSRLEELRPDSDVRYLPNWLHRSLADAVAATEGEPRPALDRPRLLYSGNLGGKQDLLRLCQALSRTELPFVFEIHTGGTGAPALREWLDTHPDSRFHLGPLLPREEDFIRSMRRCHLFVISETAGSGHSYFPSKLLPALATATPVLAVSDPSSSVGTEVRAHELGIAVDWDEIDGVAGRLEQLVRDPAPLATWSEHARARGAAFDRSTLVERLASGLESLAR